MDFAEMMNLDVGTLTYCLAILGLINSNGGENTVEEGSDFEVPTAEVVRQTLEAKGLQDDVVVFYKNDNTTADMILAVRGKDGIYRPAAIFNITFGEWGGDYYDDSQSEVQVYLFSKDNDEYTWAFYWLEFSDGVVDSVTHQHGPAPLDMDNKFRIQKSHCDLGKDSVAIHGADFHPDRIEWHPEDVDAKV